MKTTCPICGREDTLNLHPTHACVSCLSLLVNNYVADMRRRRGDSVAEKVTKEILQAYDGV